MITRVKAKGPDGKESFYVYDPQSVPLGSGHTGIVYRGSEENRPEKEVAIKVSRSASDTDMQRELEILARLYAPGEPGGDAVLWAAGGQEADVSPAAACMVMELVGGENQMSRRMNELGKRTVAGADILEKEQLATEAGRQYAQLLARMAEKGVISRGDRKATDFRLVPGNGRPERLVVLDWNRGEIIDIPALEKERRWSQDYINRRRTDLELGQTGDIRIFARWWAEFVLGRGIRGALPAIDDKTDSDWAALTRGFRDILLRAEAAGTARGFGSAKELVVALERHAGNLALPIDELRSAMAALKEKNPPTLREEMLALIDLAERRGTPESSLSGYRLTAESGDQGAMALAKQLLAEMRDSQFGRQNWDWAKSRIAETRQKMGGIMPGTAAAHLLLLRWDVAIDVARTLSSFDQKVWILDMWKLSDAMANIDVDSRAANETNDLLAGLRRGVAAGGLQPLQLELDLRAARDRATAVAAFGALQKMRPDYAAALRMLLPTLDRYLADDDGTRHKADSESALVETLQAAGKSLFVQFAADVEAGRLPPANHQAARKLREENYRPKWDAYYKARTSLNAAGFTPAEDGAAWLDALLDNMLRLQADDAAARLIDPPPAAKSALGNAADIRRRCYDRWLVQLEESATGGEPRWPDEIRRATDLANTIGTYGDSNAQTRADAVAAGLRTAKADQDNLRTRLRIATAGGLTGAESWPVFVNRITTDESPDIDETLREAVEKRLEVWQPPAVAEDAFNPDYLSGVAEGYRARTLLALRTAALLPRRVRQSTEVLNTLAAQLESGRMDVANLTSSSRAADAYGAQMVTLNTMKSQLQEFNKIKEDFAATGDVAKNRQELESWRNSLDNLINQLDAKTRTASQSIEQLAPLAQMWLVFALDQAAQLRLDEAKDSVQAARAFSSNDVIGREANAIDTAIAQLEELSKRADARTGVWGQLLQVRDAMRTGNRKDAASAWGQVQRLNPDWADNRVLQRLDQRVMAIPEKPPVVDIPSTPPESDKSGAKPGSTEAKIIPGDTATMEPAQGTPSVDLDSKVREITGLWKSSIARILPIQRPNSQQIKPAVSQTDKLLTNKMSDNQLISLQTQVKDVLKDVNWDDYDHMSSDNNYGHLYALDYKIKLLLKNNQ